MWEDGTSTKKLFPLDWPVGTSMMELIVCGATSGHMVLHCIRKQAEQSRKQHCSLASASVLVPKFPSPDFPS